MKSFDVNGRDPHGGQPVLAAGAALEEAEGVIVLLHGRGASAEDILSAYPLVGADSIAAVAPDAAGPFLAAGIEQVSSLAFDHDLQKFHRTALATVASRQPSRLLHFMYAMLHSRRASGMGGR